MAQFLTHQLDYIFFFYGLAFILLMAVCAVIYRHTEKAGLPWLLMGLFGLVHGVNEWLDLFAISLGDSVTFASIRIGVMALSFVFLTEFGRQGLRYKGGKSPGVWIYLPLFAVAISGWYVGMSGLNVTVRYALGLVGGLMSAIALWRWAKDDTINHFLSGAAVVMALYAVAAGVVVPQAPFLPAAFLNHGSFLAVTGIPIQLPRAVLAVLCTCLFWGYHQKTTQSGPFETPGKFSGLLLALSLILIMIGGWIATEFFSSAAMNEVKYDLLQISRISSAMINPERVHIVTTSNNTDYGPAYLRLRSQLTRLQETNPDMQQIIILFRKGKDIHVAADALAEGTPGHWDPDDIYTQHSEELNSVLGSGKPRITDPFEVEKRINVSAFTPLTDDTGKTIAALCINFSPANWKEREAGYRLVAIGTTLIFAVIFITFFIMLQRILKSSQQLAASQRELAEARLQKQHELEALNRNLELAVAQRTEKLTESNRELQHFAYIASHDLQEPLRTITSFIQLLAKRYQGKLDQDADEFIAFIADGAKRMKSLINDLLAYSRVDSKGRPFAPFNCGIVVEHTLANLRHAIDESGATITHDHLPDMYGDEMQMVQLFQNLIGNAVKFRGPSPLLIHIGFMDKQDAWEFSIKDNGIGIEPKYFERIFEIFQRLHNREQFVGTGIGLAVCKKIVERHGGRISVDSEPGQGATFTFSISKGVQTSTSRP